MNLKPKEFEELQPHEFVKLCDGYKWRQERQEDLFAYFVVGLMNISGKTVKKPITVKDLVKPLRRKAPAEKVDKEYLIATFNLQGGD